MHWARDRAAGRFSLERAVELLTRVPADYLGFRDRGVIGVGNRADVVVFDHARLALSPPRLVRDLPAGGKRFLQDATGYRATICAGKVVAENGRLSGEKPGRVARLR
jgi:N-acyl-D-aspartate/D-glutamate deacylase